MKKFMTAFIAVTALGLVSAQAATSDTTTGFIKNAAIGNMFEIETSKVALEKSKDEDVRAFANQMIKDHTKAGNEMKAALKKANIPASAAPKALDEKHQAQLDALKDKSIGFDKQYLDAQVAAHGEAVTVFQDYSANGDNATLKDFATKTLPTLKGHQSHINALAPEKQ